MIVIGEKLNASNRAVGEAIANRDTDFITLVAGTQAESGADYIDLNTGTGQYDYEREKETMSWLVDTVQAVTDKPLAIDSERPEIIEAILRKYPGSKMMINSITAEPGKLDTLGSLAAEQGAPLIALAMGEQGIPDNVEERLEACDTIAGHLTRLGVQMEQIYFDPLVLPISVDSRQGMVTLNTIAGIKARYPEAKTVVGLSNVSFGLPNRKLINRSFLVMAAYAGLDAAILDPSDARIMSLVKVADMLTGRDNSCRTYVRAHRRGVIAA